MVRNIRFQHWIVGLTATLVFSLTGLFLYVVQGKFQETAETGAAEKYDLIVAHAADHLCTTLSAHVQHALSLSNGALAALLKEGRPANHAATLLKASVQQYEGVYSEYLGLPNDEFVQVIAVRDKAVIRERLQAPAGTQFAVRQIQGAGPDRQEHWTFQDAHGQPLAQRTEATRYHPTQRPWYSGALQAPNGYMTAPYVFESTQQGGLTIAAPLPRGQGIYGIDISLQDLPAVLARLPLSPNALIAILDAEQRVVAVHGRGLTQDSTATPTLAPIAEAPSAWLRLLATALPQLPADGTQILRLQDTPVLVVRRHLAVTTSNPYTIVSLAPMSDFTGPVEQAKRQVIGISIGLLAVLLPLALLGTRNVTRSLSTLANDSEKLKQLDFASQPQKVASFVYEVNALGEAQEVMHRSIRERTQQLQTAQGKLSQLVENGIMLGREKSTDKLLYSILHGARDLAHCAAATLLVRTDHDTLRFALRTSADPLPTTELPLTDPETGEPEHNFVATHVALSGQTVVIDDIYSDTRFDLSGTKAFNQESGLRTVSMLTVPLSPREGKVIAVLQLINALDPVSGNVIPFRPDIVSFVEALASQAAVAIDNHHLVEEQKDLVDAMIKIIAGAIDAKSPYTGGHCERVPELAFMLADAAIRQTEGPLADFSFKNAEEWREFQIGAWLHDCGKVTTPESVVDKATKLETICNRIHEIRTRFEVLLRDAQIERLRAIHEQGQPVEQADAAYAAREAALFSDFAFIADCNRGEEFMAPEKIERLKQIAQHTWWRHFDDRLGLSHAELRRYETEPAPALPVQTPLLADQPHHIVPREAHDQLDPRYGFQLQPPQHLYNYGELYNLCIERGTLTAEERFKINEHVIQTIVMLENLPFPAYMQRVPEYAGTHHETLIGTGYPRRLRGEQLSIPARIMAIADIFEALTASDRPYKQAKSLSESIKILANFKKSQHIDPDLFDLFLTSGVYKTYAQRFLLPAQIDDVDITPYLG
ncbi:MAG TPA: HD domain-containing phosphohydrolase [Macromonas sp.]|nr:HD domain-containing phosphohydrolase [Macromonas sp.]